MRKALGVFSTCLMVASCATSAPRPPQVELCFIYPEQPMRCRVLKSPQAFERDFIDTGVEKNTLDLKRNLCISPEDVNALRRYAERLKRWGEDNCSG